MRILFVADGRSPIALNWMRYFASRDDVYLASTFACEPPEVPLKGLDIVPVAFSGLRRTATPPGAASSRSVRLRTALRQWFGPLTIPRAARGLRAVFERVQPDLVHALRIPYEGMLAADASTGVPLIVSVWGNDFTLHASSTPLMRHYTRWTLSAADALHADCQRDIRLAAEFGFAASKPSLITPGNGGVRTDIFYPPNAPVQAPIVLNPRGLRAYIRNDTFFKAIPLVLEKQPTARFLCAAMAGEPRAVHWAKALHIEHAVELLPALPYEQMGSLFRRAQVVVSPSVHDGTPNSLLEAMACGCFPVAGDLESIREWITPGANGLLADATDERALADAILLGLENKDLRERAAGLNKELILARAEYERCMTRAVELYETVRRIS
ncbi:MAG TPA: glycosyltransferase family 4 protein [Anaerolineales bacterium]|jgi:glycosyltransferase involved in cell wall biosynthesis